MVFNYGVKQYDVDLEKVFANAESEDFDYDFEENGVIINDFDGIEDFSDCSVYLYYNQYHGNVSIQLACDDYTVIRDIEFSDDELQLIKDNLSD